MAPQLTIERQTPSQNGNTNTINRSTDISIITARPALGLGNCEAHFGCQQASFVGAGPRHWPAFSFRESNFQSFVCNDVIAFNLSRMILVL